jgi:hypothetical protein
MKAIRDVTPEMAAQVVRDFILPMFDSNGINKSNTFRKQTKKNL